MQRLHHSRTAVADLSGKVRVDSVSAASEIPAVKRIFSRSKGELFPPGHYNFVPLDIRDQEDIISHPH